MSARVVRMAVGSLLVLGAAGSYAARAWQSAHAMTAADTAKIAARLARIPLRVGEPPFLGTPDTLDPRIVELSGANQYAAIDYRSESGGSVRLHVGVNVETEGWLHEPTVCMPSQGWTSTETALVPIWGGLAGAEPGGRIWRMKLEKSGAKLLVYYWFQWGDHLVTSFADRAKQRFHGLLAGDSDRPVEIVIFYTPLEQSEFASEARIESLARALWPALSTVLSRGD